VGSLLERLERLEQREAAARRRVEALRAEMDGLAERLADQEELLGFPVSSLRRHRLQPSWGWTPPLPRRPAGR
jgi:chromosome segregation ATPase